MSAKSINVKFVKYDKFKQAMFVVSKDSEEYSEEFKRVTLYCKKLTSKYSNMPIWIDNEKSYATLTFKKCSTLSKLKENAVYTIVFDFHETKVKTQKFINLIAKEVKLLKEVDNGTRVEITSDIEISDED
jgi:hypothetical protein